MSLQFSSLENVSQLFSSDIQTVKKNIHDFNVTSPNKISYKIKDNMLIIFNDFVRTPTKNELFNKSRSLVLTNQDDKYKIVAFTHPVVDYNNLGKLVDFSDKQFVECYEGTLISVYFCNDKWNYSTRKCLDAHDSYWAYNGNHSTMSHFDMFAESLASSVNELSVDEFESKLDKTQSYYFVLVHHQNKTFVDYTEKFGADYKKAFLLFVRDSEMNVTNEYNVDLKQYVDTSASLSCDEVKVHVENDKNVMGYLFNLDGQFYVYHTKFYEQLEVAAPYSYSYESMLLELYKRDNLNANFALYPENVKYRGSQFDTKGVMYGVFTYLSMSLVNLYYYYTTYDGVKLGHRNDVDFKVLFDDNKNNTLHGLLYKMKGMVLSQKKKLELSDVKKMLKYYISSPDLIRCLKEFDEFKKTNSVLFMKMNPKYNDNAIVNLFVGNL
jgi:hypothetical protein